MATTTTRATDYQTDSEYVQDLDFVLVRQKDRILELVSAAEYALVDETAPSLPTVQRACRSYRQAIAALSVVAELWGRCNYGYKTHEICERIKATVDAQRLELPKNAPVKRSEWSQVLNALAADVFK